MVSYLQSTYRYMHIITLQNLFLLLKRFNAQLDRYLKNVAMNVIVLAQTFNWMIDVHPHALKDVAVHLV